MQEEPAGLRFRRLLANREGAFHPVFGKQAKVVAATNMVLEGEDRIRADSRLQGASVHVSESGGIITLSGEVHSRAQRAAAVEDLQIKGVKVLVDNLHVINPDDQHAAAVEDSAASSALPSKASSEALSAPSHHVYSPAVNKTMPPSRPTNTASHGNAAPLTSVSPKGHGPNSDVSAGNASTSEAAPAVQRSIRIREQMTVPEGTVLAVQLTESLSSDRNETGDIFHARLASPILVGNKVVMPAGAILDGRIVNARSGGRIYGDSALTVKVTRLAYNGKTYELRSSLYLKQGGSQTRRLAATLGTGTGVGAILGAIAGGGKGAVIGAAIGAGAGSGIQVMSKAAQVQIPAKSMLHFRLETPLTIIPS